MVYEEIYKMENVKNYWDYNSKTSLLIPRGRKVEEKRLKDREKWIEMKKDSDSWNDYCVMTVCALIEDKFSGDCFDYQPKTDLGKKLLDCRKKAMKRGNIALMTIEEVLEEARKRRGDIGDDGKN